jgi:hypothetical protein
MHQPIHAIQGEAPSLLEACGASVPRTMQGRSFLPLVQGRRDGWIDEVYIHMSEFTTGRILRTPRLDLRGGRAKASRLAGRG